MSKRRGTSAAAWFYGQPGFRTLEPEPPYVVMSCVGCGTEYKIGPKGSPSGPKDDEHPSCPKDFMPLATVRAVAR